MGVLALAAPVPAVAELALEAVVAPVPPVAAGWVVADVDAPDDAVGPAPLGWKGLVFEVCAAAGAIATDSVTTAAARPRRALVRTLCSRTRSQGTGLDDGLGVNRPVSSSRRSLAISSISSWLP